MSRPGPWHRTFLLTLGALWLLPLYLLLVNAMRPHTDYEVGAEWVPPQESGLLDNLVKAWEEIGLGPSIVSTLLYSTVSPALAVLIGAAAGFAIVALRLRHGFAWFAAVFGGTVIPGQMLLMPVFLGYSATYLYDTRAGMILIYTVLAVPLAAFVMRNFFTGIARSVYEAAVIDGATPWRIFWRIYLPMSSSALGAVFVLAATFTWNELLFGLTLSQSEAVRPLMTALSAAVTAYAGSTVPVVLAAGTLVSLPTVLLFLLTRRLFVRGLALGQL